MNGSDEFVSLRFGYPTKGVAHSASQEATLSVQHQIKTKRIRALFFVTGEDSIELVKACPDVEQARSVLYDIAKRLHQERPSVDLSIIEEMMDNIRLYECLGAKIQFSEGFSLLQRALKAQDGTWTIPGGTASNVIESSTKRSESDSWKKAAGYDSTESFVWQKYTVGEATSDGDRSVWARETEDTASVNTPTG